VHIQVLRLEMIQLCGQRENLVAKSVRDAERIRSRVVVQLPNFVGRRI